MLRTVTATRYVTPLREGGSLPAIVEGDDEGLYVVKFRGAGQGPRVLLAELIVGELGRALGLPVPEIVFCELDPALGRNEPRSNSALVGHKLERERKPTGANTTQPLAPGHCVNLQRWRRKQLQFDQRFRPGERRRINSRFLDGCR